MDQQARKPEALNPPPAPEMPSFAEATNILEHRMVSRMKRAELVERNILKRGEASAELLERQQALQKSRIHSRLARTFRTRPTFESLQEANIVPTVSLSPAHLDVQKKLLQRQRAQLLEERLARRPSVDMLRGGEIMPFVALNPRELSDDAYLESAVYPVLEPALAALMEALERRQGQRERGVHVEDINPLNFLAERLMRANVRS